MKNNTEIDYRNAIRVKYELEKTADFHGFLEKPSPAQLRELCLLKLDNGLNKIDESIFRMYYKISDTENLRDTIYNYYLPKFKSVRSFLIEDNKKTNIQNLNLIAVLVDFNPRPFNKFSKGISSADLSDTKIEGNNAIDGSKYLEGVKNSDLIVGNPIGIPVDKWSVRKKVGITICVIVAIFSAGYTTKQFISPKKECMQWENDHYELVDCKSDKLGIVSTKKPYTEIEFNRKKIIVCDTFTFFKNNEPIVWYSKKDNVVEFFNMDGKNPENNCELKQITQHMIDKYVKPCK